MDSFADRPANERAEVFEATAADRGIGQAIIVEKDFWVCWALHQLRPLFGEIEAIATSRDSSRITQPHVLAGLSFKGGTSLSKVYHLVDRFSEDIDLTIDRATLGFGHLQNPESGLSNRRRREMIDGELVQASTSYVRDVVVPLLTERVRSLTDTNSAEGLPRVRLDPRDPQSVVLAYPRALSDRAYAALSYLQPEVRLEFGARGDVWPSHRAVVSSYAAEQYPKLFSHPRAAVNVLDLARTLWEKATILHEVAHRGLANVRDRLSRHYYDLARITASEAGRAALQEPALLIRVAEDKGLFFPRPTARYDLARPGTLRLIPDTSVLKELRRDYVEMRQMFFGEPPSFDEIIATLQQVEADINSP